MNFIIVLSCIRKQAFFLKKGDQGRPHQGFYWHGRVQIKDNFDEEDHITCAGADAAINPIPSNPAGFQSGITRLAFLLFYSGHLCTVRLTTPIHRQGLSEYRILFHQVCSSIYTRALVLRELKPLIIIQLQLMRFSFSLYLSFFIVPAMETRDSQQRSEVTGACPKQSSAMTLCPPLL